MRRGAWVVLVVVAAISGAASARADGPTTTGGTTTTTPSATSAPLAASRLPETCVGAGAAAISEPAQRVLALGTPASSLAGSAYPEDAPVVSFASSTASGSTCRTAHVALTSLSLFGGAVTASTVEATDGRGSVTGLEIDGAPVDAQSGETVPVDDWGQLTLGADVGRLTSPLVLRLVAEHGSLPAGAVIVVAFGATAAPAAKLVPARGHAGSTQTRKQPQARHRMQKHHRRKKGPPRPLKWTPKLGLSPEHYVFPVDGGASYVDTYGANRSDIYDGWHHGDDLFAPLGTPVVAVVRGKLSLVGWNKIGGWRLWLTDKKGNSFYYAHLAGYARRILHHHHVKAGEVIGFLGRTGDAFTTTPHLHFEIHPHQLLKLKYDGAVDPTRYLRKWKVVRVPKKDLPQPARLRAPRGAPAEEAAVVWHELLVARHLLPATVPTVIRRPFPAAPKPVPPRRLAADRRAAGVEGSSGGPWPTFGIAFLGLVAVALAALALLRRLRG